MNDLPVGTIAFLAVLFAGAYSLVADKITFEEFAEYAVAYNGIGSAAIGFVRNQAGKGIRR